MAAVACNSSHRITHDVELSYTNINNANHMFDNAIAFETKFNNGNSLPKDTNNLKVWFKENRDMMLAIDIKVREKDNLDSFYNNLESLYNNLDNKNLE